MDHGYDLNHETATTIHEIGHFFGAIDHYVFGETDELNKVNPGLYDDNCIYGYYKDTDDVCSNLRICDGYVGVMRGTIILPEEGYQ